MIEFQASSPAKLNGIIRKLCFTYSKAADANTAVGTCAAHRQHSRRRRSAPTNSSVFKSELTGLNEYTMFSIQVSFYTVDLGPYSEVVNVSTDEGGGVFLMAVEIERDPDLISTACPKLRLSESPLFFSLVMVGYAILMVSPY